MQKSTLIATCLFNSSMVTNLDVGERIVRHVFDDNFKGIDFAQWNVSLPVKTAQSIIAGVGRAMRIDVRKFIADLAVMSRELEPTQQRSSDDDDSDGDNHDAPAEQSATSGATPDATESSGKRFNGRT